jgi:P2 family phage major capsid protein
MKTKTKLAFKAVIVALAATYAVTSMSDQFTVSPTVEQKLYDKVYESAEFLQRINTQMVDDKVGSAVTLGLTSSVTGRAGVSTDGNERSTKDPSGLTDREYRCYEVECDTHITWAQIDQWAKFPDFAVRWRNHVRQVIALDIIKIGWNGTSAANITDMATYPLLQDVNIGWLQLVRRDAPERVLTDGEQQVGEIRIGEGGDYANLDEAVHDLLQGIELHKRIGMVAIIGSDLIAADKGKKYAAQADTPSEKGLIELEQVIGTYGSLKSYQVPFFPVRGILVTSFQNLAHLIQNGTTRTHIEENHKKKRIEDYQSRNDCYFINDLESIIFIEGSAVKITRVKHTGIDFEAVTFDPLNPEHFEWS